MLGRIGWAVVLLFRVLRLVVLEDNPSESPERSSSLGIRGPVKKVAALEKLPCKTAAPTGRSLVDETLPVIDDMKG